ncbi:MAG: ABC transporter ATP-binding protein [Phaeodactylibacter sp.]|nr:ABC transporter ATP-binding protein [Phaeodactylibacter sp.]MCB9302066.1 ABC transporter ATP-binding protein [Lewinellaceae bacterium]
MKSPKSSIWKNPYLSLLHTAWQYAGGQRRRYSLIYSMFVISNLVVAMEPVIWGIFINNIQKQGLNILRSAWIYAGAYLLIKLLDWGAHGPARIMERDLAFSLSRNFLQELYHKALHLPVRWHQDHHSGATINRIRKAYEALKDFFDSGFMYLKTFLSFVFSFAAMIYFSPLFGLIAAVMGAGVIFVLLKFDKPFIQASREVNEKEHVVSSTLFDSLSNIITVITLRLEQRMEKGLLNRVMDILPPFRRKVMVNEWKWFVMDICVGLIYGVILVGYIYQNWVPGEVFLIGSLVTLMAYVQRFTSVFHGMAWQYTQVVRYHTDVQTAQNIFEAFEKYHLPDLDAALPEGWRQLEIGNLHFTHNDKRPEDEKAQGLHGLNLRISRGKRVALIGESGSGKSTLMAILRGLYTPEAGLQLSADGQPVKNLAFVANRVTLFPQEPEIFENTIEYNITLGLPFGEDEVRKVCQVAQFGSVVEQLPRGLQSSIKEKGVNLSGGQKQRLALARGILAGRDSDIILMDEPTSSVDPKTEVQIYQRLFEEFKDKAIVSSLHRLHLLNQFDYVYILADGRVVDEGAFPYLRAQSPAFRELWRHQEAVMAGME